MKISASSSSGFKIHDPKLFSKHNQHNRLTDSKLVRYTSLKPSTLGNQRDFSRVVLRAIAPVAFVSAA
jgi:hypothetical protein